LTCSTEGVETKVCLLNASHTETRAVEIDPDAHEWGGYTVVIPATDTTDGAEIRICLLNAAHTVCYVPFVRN